MAYSKLVLVYTLVISLINNFLFHKHLRSNKKQLNFLQQNTIKALVKTYQRCFQPEHEYYYYNRLKIKSVGLLLFKYNQNFY